MPTLPAPSWPSLPVFPAIAETLAFGREHKTDHLETDALDVFRARWEQGRWRVSLAGVHLLAAQIDEWDAFVDVLRGMWSPFLFTAKSRRFQMQNALIGVGNGTATAFQLKKTRSYQGRDRAEIVRFPVHNWPQMPLFPGGPSFLETQLVSITVGGVEMPWLSGWDLNRETGLVTFSTAPANGAEVRASCRYAIKMHGSDFMPVESSGGEYVFSQGAELFEPKGDDS